MVVWRDAVRYAAALVLMLGLLAGSLGQAAAQDDDEQESGDTSVVTMSVSSLDPAVANTMPDGASWTISSTIGGGVVASGVFSGEQLELPTSFEIETPIPYDEYLVTVAATWTFGLYERTHTIDSPTQTLSVELEPYVEQPVASSLSVSMADGSEAEVSLRWALDDAESGETVAGGSDIYSIPTTLWAGDLMAGDYWVSIYPDGDYAAISELVTVLPRVPSAPFEFALVSTAPEPTDVPTETPTAEPTLDPTEEPTEVPTETPTTEPTHTDTDKGKDDEKKEEVTILPTTGQGSGSGTDSGAWVMTFGAVSLLLLAASLAWYQRRIQA